MDLLFERTMLWNLIELQRNLIELVKIKGTSKRQERPYPSEQTHLFVASWL